MHRGNEGPAFWKNRRADLLPYLAWVAFATVLCLETWRLNPVILS